MAVESKPLFHPEVIRQQVRSFKLPETIGAAQPKLQHWVDLIASVRADDFKERDLLPDFLTDIFVIFLAHVRPVRLTGSRYLAKPTSRRYFSVVGGNELFRGYI